MNAQCGTPSLLPHLTVRRSLSSGRYRFAREDWDVSSLSSAGANPNATSPGNSRLRSRKEVPRACSKCGLASVEQRDRCFSIIYQQVFVGKRHAEAGLVYLRMVACCIPKQGLVRVEEGVFYSFMVDVIVHISFRCTWKRLHCHHGQPKGAVGYGTGDVLQLMT